MEPTTASRGITVRMREIRKRYPNGVLANDGVDLELLPGEIHALVGENGAGKSTLMSILDGLEPPTSGSVLLDDREVRFASPHQAAEAGIGMVHQEFKLFPSLSVAENVVFGAEPTRGGAFLDPRSAVRRVRELAERFGLQVDPEARVDRLTVGVQQRVEVLKALHRDSRVLILDEPTAVLTPPEVDGLFAMLRRLADDGRTIVVVTHKLREVFEFTDRITVLRDGRTVATTPTADSSPAGIAAAMTGRAVDVDARYAPGVVGERQLVVRDLRVVDAHGATVVEHASLEVRSGEIVGIAGVAGSGQSELLDAVAGVSGAATGVVELGGRSLLGLGAADRRAAGLAYIPGDRRGVGSAIDASVADNLALGFHRRPPLRRGWRLDRRALRAHADRLIGEFGVAVADQRAEAGTLSGGNLQKVIVARELSHDASLLLVDQPTRGVDIGAIENIHARLRDYRDAGRAVLMTSAELSELFALADRILVMFSGRVVAEFDRANASEAAVGLAMTGVVAENGEAS